MREVAEKLNISVAAVHNSLKRHKKELKNHIQKKGNKLMLDEYAQHFIMERSSKSLPNELIDQSIMEELQQLRKENSNLKDIIIQKQQVEIQTTHLLAASEHTEKLLEEKTSELQEAKEKIEEMRTFTGWLKNRK